MPEKEQRQGFKPVTQSIESSEQNAKEHLNLRLTFAKEAARVLGKPLEFVLPRYTDTYARIFWQRRSAAEAEADPRWQAYVHEIQNGADPVETALDIRHQYAQEKAGVLSEPREFFGPFRYDYDEAEHAIDIHFGSMGWSDDERDAPVNFTQDTKPALERMFREIKKRHPDAKIVSGGSWLYTRMLESAVLKPVLSELFPASFLESRNNSQWATGGGRWGQFIDNRGKVHLRRATQLIENIKQVKPDINPEKTRDAILAAFPIQPRLLKAPIGDFYKFYGIE